MLPLLPSLAAFPIDILDDAVALADNLVDVTVEPVIEAEVMMLPVGTKNDVCAIGIEDAPCTEGTCVASAAACAR